MTLFMHNTKLEEVMRLHQKGEVMLVVMVVMMAVVWMVSGHMGMKGLTENPAETAQPAKAEQILPSAPEESPEHQH